MNRIGRYNFKITCLFSETCSLQDGFNPNNKHTQTPKSPTQDLKLWKEVMTKPSD